MNLRNLANSATQVVNPNRIVNVRVSTGFTIGAGAKQIPTYSTLSGVSANIQSLSSKDIEHKEGLNIQGVTQVLFARGELSNILRANQTGGDLIKFGNPEETWLVAAVMESWPGWIKALIVRQMND